MKAASIGISVLLMVFLYTIYLIRAGKLNAHMAISWVGAEVIFIVMMMSDALRASLKAFLGDQNAPYSLFLFGAVWIVFLMLESLTAISSLTSKLKQVNQELALTREHLYEIEKKLLNS